MKVLVVGGGGREHALAWHIAQSDAVEHVFCSPGNPGTEGEVGVSNIALPSGDHQAICSWANGEGISLVVIGPEAPLVEGLGDALREAGIPTVGPGADAARLEGSKAFAKEVMVAGGVPTAAYREVRTADEVNAACDAFAASDSVRALVVKADGLAAGKGVVVCEGIEDARLEALRFLDERPFGDASDTIVLEERLEGVEASYIVLVSGESYVALPIAQDHKRLLAGDEGPNTGGMGAYTPTPFIDAPRAAEIERDVIVPTLREIAARGLDFRGFLFVGLMLTDTGVRVLEYNVRLGDPETQVLMRSLRSDLVPYLVDAAAGRELRGELAAGVPSAVVVMAAEGYPQSPRKGDVIEGLSAAAALPGVVVFHAGTGRDEQGRVVTSGGRVLGVSACGDELEEALERAYAAVGAIHWRGAQHRADIGYQVRPKG